MGCSVLDKVGLPKDIGDMVRRIDNERLSYTSAPVHVYSIRIMIEERFPALAGSIAIIEQSSLSWLRQGQYCVWAGPFAYPAYIGERT